MANIILLIDDLFFGLVDFWYSQNGVIPEYFTRLIGH